jgi:hypothetical protein
MSGTGCSKAEFQTLWGFASLSIHIFKAWHICTDKLVILPSSLQHLIDFSACKTVCRPHKCKSHGLIPSTYPSSSYTSPSKIFPCIPVQLSRHSAHRNLVVVTFVSNKCFGYKESEGDNMVGKEGKPWMPSSVPCMGLFSVVLVLHIYKAKHKIYDNMYASTA